MEQNIYLARHPILDKYNRIFAYELLYRSETGNIFPGIDGDVASRSLLHRLLMDFGIKRISGGKPVFINFTESYLMDDSILLLPPEHVVLEILETAEPTPELLSRCRFLQEKGYKFALDDFEWNEKWIPFFEVVNFVKVDFILVKDKERGEILKRIKNKQIFFIAEKVENNQDFIEAKQLNYHFFQGFFFCKPSILTTKKIPENRLNYFQVLQEINKPDFSFDALEIYFKRDLSLTYKLLKFINSSYFNLPNKVTSIKSSLTLLGYQTLRKWVTLLALDSLIDNKPQELIRISLTRALFCEAIGRLIEKKNSTDNYFLTGLFSLIDAILDKSRDDIFSEISVDPIIINTLNAEKTVITPVLELSISMEQGEFELAGVLAQNKGLDKKLVIETFLSSMMIADSLIESSEC